MSRQRVLFICHNHPNLHPGGSEILAYDLFKEMKAGDEVEPMFLACTNRTHRLQKPGTVFQAVGRSGDEVILWAGHFDHFFQSQIDLHGMVPELSNFLSTFRPDVVHFHHTLLIGVEMLFLVRRVLPHAKIVFTLHDYYAICANHGQMVKTADYELCRAANADACAKCFPDLSPDKFMLRAKHLQRMFGLVDHFISPSKFLRRRYAGWGLDPERIAVVPNGRPEARIVPHRSTSGARDMFGYFGNLSPYKGVLTAIEAARLVRTGGSRATRLMVNGGYHFQADTFREKVEAAARRAGRGVVMSGTYDRDAMPRLMRDVDWVVVPSIWWENAPLVIQEAFQQRRPVICSDIGGMAEMVEDGISGLHFRAGDAHSLSEVMRRAMDDRSLWETLVTNIPPVPTMAETVRTHLALYREPRRGVDRAHA